MKKVTLVISLCLALAACDQALNHNTETQSQVRTTFQTTQPWRPTMDNRADAVMIYGIYGDHRIPEQRKAFHDRIKSWSERGYSTHFMTGIAWGEYQDFFSGAWDGSRHDDNGQVRENGDTVWHHPGVPYIVPTDKYIEYFNQQHIQPVIDAGINEIFLEEPEFWAFAGYSQAFKDEWQKYYGFEWRPQHTSPENTYLSNKLKYHLYYEALRKTFSYAKEYGRTKGMDVKCYVPTHSLLSYTQIQMVSPEASLASLDCVDGYIAQVWTGTARMANLYNGVIKERCFEGAFLEYGSMASMTEPTGRKMFFLTDPVEDARRDWADYKRNYEATFTAQLLYPQIGNYEIMPWPERIYEGLYPINATSDQMASIPSFYATQMQVMINALNNMPVCDSRIDGTQGISIAMANSLMFQRYPTHAGYEDPYLSNFFGLAMPLLKRGVPISITHLENTGYKKSLENIRVLIMSYSNLKPLDHKTHHHISEWVKKGGTLIYCSRDNDPFQNVMEWWNSNGNKYTAPSQHLFELMAIPPAEGEHKFGKGAVYIMRNDPKEFVAQAGSESNYIDVVCRLFKQSTDKEVKFKNHLHLSRGMYEVIAVMDESTDNNPYKIDGLFIDLYDPTLPIINRKVIHPNEQALLINLNKLNRGRKAQILASGYRAEEWQHNHRTISFVAKGPINTIAPSRILLPKAPKRISIDGVDITASTPWDEESSTLLLQINNTPDGRKIEIEW